MASLVPEPMEKCAVALASPISTMLPWVQRSQRMVGKLRQIERLMISLWPASSSANTLFEEARRRCLVELVEPGARESLRIGLHAPRSSGPASYW